MDRFEGVSFIKSVVRDQMLKDLNFNAKVMDATNNVPNHT